MGGIVGALVGLAIAIFGFLVMRNPMRLSILAPGELGYYQRMVLDKSSRNSLRAFGMLMCLFGAGVATAGLGAAFKAHALQAMSDGLWSLIGGTVSGAVVHRHRSCGLAGSSEKVVWLV